MERSPESSDRVQVSKAVFDGLEFIRRSGATNMLDRPVVLQLAREWELTATADWIERVDTKTYGQLILQGPSVIPGDDPTNDVTEDDPFSPAFYSSIPEDLELSIIDDTTDRERARWQAVILHLGKLAALTIADTYETEQMGVLADNALRQRINDERTALFRNVIEASTLGFQLEETLGEIERGIAALQELIDPENN